MTSTPTQAASIAGGSANDSEDNQTLESGNVRKRKKLSWSTSYGTKRRKSRRLPVRTTSSRQQDLNSESSDNENSESGYHQTRHSENQQQAEPNEQNSEPPEVEITGSRWTLDISDLPEDASAILQKLSADPEVTVSETEPPIQKNKQALEDVRHAIQHLLPVTQKLSKRDIIDRVESL